MHEPYICIVPGARMAVLFIHGIIGTPEHFRVLMPLEREVPENWSVCNLLLPGHGGTAEDFGRSSMKAWREHVFSCFEDLAKTHEQVFVVAHSMGTLFAIELGLQYPEKIPALFLLAVPMRPGLRWFGIKNMLRVGFGMVREDHPMEVATKLACGIETTRRVWKYIPWIPRYLELFYEIWRVEKTMGGLTIPCTAWQSHKDELVRNRSRKVLEKFPQIRIRDLYDSSHFFYTDADREAIIAAFRTVCEEIKTHD